MRKENFGYILMSVLEQLDERFSMALLERLLKNAQPPRPFIERPNSWRGKYRLIRYFIVFPGNIAYRGIRRVLEDLRGRAGLAFQKRSTDTQNAVAEP